jgi:glycosyltransferase involved in cell wall biosynthesis
MLMNVIVRVLQLHPTVTFDIFGRQIPAIERWHSELENSLRDRVCIHGVRPSADVMKALSSSQILYCPSVEEGVPLSVVEALCGGCTVVGLGSPAVPGLFWAFLEDDGGAAHNDSIEAHAEALITELLK